MGKRASLVEDLQNLRKDYENRGLCHALSNDDCNCPLCVIDDSIRILSRLKLAFEKGMMTEELMAFLVDLKRKD